MVPACSINVVIVLLCLTLWLPDWKIKNFRHKLILQNLSRPTNCIKLHNCIMVWVDQQHLISHSESGSSGHLLWSARNKDQSREILKSACCSNKGTQFQTKGSISDGAPRVTYYNSWGFVSCNFIFHVICTQYLFM